MGVAFQPTVRRAEVARRLWHDYLKVEYYAMSQLARDEWDPDKASHCCPAYDAQGNRIMGQADLSTCPGADPVYLAKQARDDHYAVRTYAWDTTGVGHHLVEEHFPDAEIFGPIASDGWLPNGVKLVGRIMGCLGYRRGTNNLGPTYFNLNDKQGRREKNMFADAIHLDPPIDAPELPKQFVSQIHLNDLKTTHPKLAVYLETIQKQTHDPMAGLEDVMAALAADQPVTETDAHAFLEAAAASIKERPWQVPLERAAQEKWDAVRWASEVQQLKDVIAEHEADPTEASQYAVWTLFNGLRVNHEAFLTGNIWDTMLVHVIEGRKVIDPAGTEKSLINDETGGTEYGGLLQAAVAAIDRVFTFEGPKGCEPFAYAGQGPFVEYIERTLVEKDGQYVRLNDAFLPGNAKQVFQSTMPKTRGAQSWADDMRGRLQNDPNAVFEQLLQKGWMRSARAMLLAGHVKPTSVEKTALRQRFSDRADVQTLLG